jgi:lysophospholipase
MPRFAVTICLLLYTVAGAELPQIRALPNSPSGDYAPKAVDCPSDKPTIRVANGLSDQEKSWLLMRRNSTIEPMRDLLSRANISNFDVDAFIENASSNATELPNIGIAVSGGGYRALMNAAGFIQAADSRNNGNGTIRGLLESATYLAGLSGGGWLVGSIYANNFSSVADFLKEDSKVWQFQNSIFTGPKESGIDILNTVDYWSDIRDDVEDKKKGFNVSITDYWGRALSYQLINAKDGGPSYTFSSISDTEAFKNGSIPFPILVSGNRAPGTTIVSTNATVYEFNPFEMGSWDPTTFGFAPLEYIGSDFTNGSIPDNGKCVRGFDQLGFIIGTTSSLFNEATFSNIFSNLNGSGIPSFILDAFQTLLNDVADSNGDIANYDPNPFYQFDPTNEGVDDSSDQLSLVDGGEDFQNIPLHPLIQPVREVDIIFAIDSSADTDSNWPNGTALRATYNRAGTDVGNGTLFPAIPSAETFINLGLNRRPTLFGCNATNFTLEDGESVPPLIFYIPNAPYTTHSNVSTLDPEYPITQRDAIILNGFNAATQGNATIDQDWPRCVACAILSRSWSKAGQMPPGECATCYERYCWNGTTDDTSVNSYEPDFIIGQDSSTENNDSGGGDDDGVAQHTASLMLVAILAGACMLWIGL